MNWMSTVGCSGASDKVACLRSASLQGFVNATGPILSFFPNFFNGATPPELGFGLTFGPNIDGYVLPAQPRVRIAAGQHNKVPVVVGSTRDEANTFMVMAAAGLFTGDWTKFIFIATCTDRHNRVVTNLGATLASAVDAMYPCSGLVSGPTVSYAQGITHAQYECPARRMARALVTGQTNPVRRYWFTHKADHIGVFQNLLGIWPGMGAGHALDVPFVFNTHGSMLWYWPSTRELDLTTRVESYWRAMAASGDPNYTGGNSWPAYDRALDNALNLKAVKETGTSDPGPEMNNGIDTSICDFWDTQYTLDGWTGQQSSGSAAVIFDEAFASGWDASWGWSGTWPIVNTRASSGSNSIAWTTTAGNGGLYLHSGAGQNTTGYDTLSFSIYVTTTGQTMSVNLYDTTNNFTNAGVLITPSTVNGWQTISIPLSSLNGTNKVITGVQLQDQTGTVKPTAWVDQVQFTSASAASPTITASRTLNTYATLPGSTVTGSVTYKNNTASSMTLASLVLSAQPPGGTWGSYEFTPALTNYVLGAGQSVTLNGSLTLPSNATPGPWLVASRYKDINGTWTVESAVTLNVEGALTVTAPRALSTYSTTRGSTVTGTATYTNNTAGQITIAALVISCQPPGGSWGAYEFSPPILNYVLDPGQSVTLNSSLTIPTNAPTGNWLVASTYKDVGGGWTGEAAVTLTVSP